MRGVSRAVACAGACWCRSSSEVCRRPLTRAKAVPVPRSGRCRHRGVWRTTLPAARREVTVALTTDPTGRCIAEVITLSVPSLSSCERGRFVPARSGPERRQRRCVIAHADTGLRVVAPAAVAADATADTPAAALVDCRRSGRNPALRQAGPGPAPGTRKPLAGIR